MTTYAQLTSDAADWLKRSDLAASIPGFVALAEAKFNRSLRVRHMEESITGTIDASNEIAQPSDWLAMKTIWADGYEGAPLTSQSLESVIGMNSTSGPPTVYAVKSGALRFDGSGDVTGVYFKKIPALQTSSTNWLSAIAYDAYLFQVLAEASLWSMDEKQAAIYGARAEAAIQQVQDNDMRDRFSGALAARKR